MARHMVRNFEQRQADVHLIDLQDVSLPMCDGGACYGDANVQEISKQLAGAQGIVLATPIYNYDVNAAAKKPRGTHR